MFSLKPTLDTLPRKCPNCHAIVSAKGFLITGMRNLTNFQCFECQNEFFGDLPAGQGLFTPILLEKESGKVFDDFKIKWFSDWLADSYANRTSKPLVLNVRKFSKVKDKVVLLNCLDTLYGHSLLKLLNAQHYIDQKPDFSLIVIIPPFLEWMLPEGIAEAWIVDLPLRHGTEWNDWLAQQIADRLELIPEVYMSIAFSHPHAEDFEIERFTRIRPFALENFKRKMIKPVITFIWREDRLWHPPGKNENFGLLNKLRTNRNKSQNQTDKVIKFAEKLRAEFPQIDFAVAGIGQFGKLPDWITDLRLTTVNSQAERNWCERYAKSHLVAGVHGSNMLLPTAHAGSVIELIDYDRHGNYLQDMLFQTGDTREIMFRHRFVPHSTTPEELAELALTMLRYEDFRRLFSPEFCRHQERYDFEKWLTLTSSDHQK